MRIVAALIATLVLFGACTDSREPEAGPPAAIDRQAGLVEELRIDGHAHDLVPFDLQSSGSVAVAPDGTIAINQMQDHLVRFFGPAGEPLGAFGGKGSGPGEFERPVEIGWLADSLWIYDTALHRVTLLTPERGLARTLTLASGARPTRDQRGSMPETDLASVVGLGPGGTVLSHVLPYDDRSPAAFRHHTFYAALTQTGTIKHVVARIPNGETSVVADGGSASIPFSNRTVSAVSRDGSRAAFARADPVAVEPSVQVHAFTASGDTVFVVRRPIEVVPLPDAVRDSVVDRFAARLTFSSSLADRLREAADRITVYPPLQDLIVGRDGTLWIALADREGERPYLAFDPDGEPLGRVHVSDRSRIAEAERDRIWVIEKDEFDVESLIRYRVEW